MAIEALRGWTSSQKHTVAASYLGWTLDALDYFLLIYVVKDVAAEFHVGLTAISLAVTATLVMRPVGAYIFGRLADHYGRRPVLMINILTYSLLSFSTAFVPNLTVFLIVRTLFGIGMGGVWGIGASLAMEAVKKESRGFVSGLLQSGYASGYLIASAVFGVIFVHVGWRGMFMVGIIPALLLIPYIYAKVPESPSFDRTTSGKTSMLDVLRQHWKLALFAIILMTAFNFFSHGIDDFYPTFLRMQHHYVPAMASRMGIIYNVGSIIGCFLFASLSQNYGRRRIIIIAALLSILAIGPAAFSTGATMIALGAFALGFFIKGCWGIVPAYLNELSPAAARSTFPGTVYQIGNLIAAANLTIQSYMVDHNVSYAVALAIMPFISALAVAALLAFGPEAHNADLKA